MTSATGSATAHRATILTFHGVGRPVPGSDPTEADYWIPRDLLLWVLDEVAERPDVRITVDDGFSSDVETVLPALLERGLHGVFFPLTGRLGQPDRLDADGIRALAGAGMGIGVHGHTHKIWTDCGPGELDSELDDSRTMLHELSGRPVTTAAAPLGAYDRRVLATLVDLGFASLYTSDRAVADERRWLRPRFSIRAQDDRASVSQILARRPSLVRDGLDRARLIVKSRR